MLNRVVQAFSSPSVNDVDLLDNTPKRPARPTDAPLLLGAAERGGYASIGGDDGPLPETEMPTYQQYQQQPPPQPEQADPPSAFSLTGTFADTGTMYSPARSSSLPWNSLLRISGLTALSMAAAGERGSGVFSDPLSLLTPTSARERSSTCQNEPSTPNNYGGISSATGAAGGDGGSSSSSSGGVDDEHHRLVDRGGHFFQSLGKVSIRKKIKRRDWRALYAYDLFHSLVDAPTSRTICILLCVYVTIILFFSVVYFSISQCWGQCNMDLDNFQEAFFFSLETMATIGYGTRDIFFGDCLLPAIALTLHMCTRLVTDAITVGLIYSRLARPTTRASTVLFSNHAIIRRIRGKLYLMFQLCELRKHQLNEAHVRLYAVRRERDAGQYLQMVREAAATQATEAIASAAAAAAAAPSTPASASASAKASAAFGGPSSIDIERVANIAAATVISAGGASTVALRETTQQREQATSHFQTCHMRLNHPNDELGGMLLLCLPQVIVHEIDAASPLMPPPIWAGATPLHSWDMRDSGATGTPGTPLSPNSPIARGTGFGNSVASAPEMMARLSSVQSAGSDGGSMSARGGGGPGCGASGDLEEGNNEAEADGESTMFLHRWQPPVVAANFPSQLCGSLTPKADHDESVDSSLQFPNVAQRGVDRRPMRNGRTVNNIATSAVNAPFGFDFTENAAIETREQMLEREMIQAYMADRKMEIIAVVEGMDAATGGVVQARHSFISSEISWHKAYAPCIQADDEERGFAIIDFSKFHQLVPVSPDAAWPGVVSSYI